MQCLICRNNDFICIHQGTRDVKAINVMKCSCCGMVQLDNTSYNTESNYEEGGMLKDNYSISADQTENLTWDVWLKNTEVDDDRRYKDLKKLCEGKSVLEFGCGNGGFLRRIKNVAASVAGVELMEEARSNIEKEGIPAYKTMDEIDRKLKYDVICMFMVIEHLNNPDEILKKIYDSLKENGIFVCETVNADDALISKYHSSEFENFTYWSEHVLLFNSDTLEHLINRNGFQTVINTQIQRYSLGNHLYWLSNGKPGGACEVEGV